MRLRGGAGIDNLSQLVPGAVHTPDGTWNVNNNFPKLASSAAHLFGRPKVWTEGGGGRASMASSSWIFSWCGA